MAEGGGLLNRYRLVKAYRGFESLRLRQLNAAPHFSIPHARELAKESIGCASLAHGRQGLASARAGAAASFSGRRFLDSSRAEKRSGG